MGIGEAERAGLLIKGMERRAFGPYSAGTLSAAYLSGFNFSVVSVNIDVGRPQCRTPSMINSRVPESLAILRKEVF